MNKLRTTIILLMVMCFTALSATNFVYTVWKVGDQDVGVYGLKDGMLVNYIDPDVYNPVFSDHMKKVFVIAKVPRLWLPTLKTASVKNQNEAAFNASTYRSRKSLITFSDMEALVNSPGLEDSWRSIAVVEIQDWTSLNISIIKSSATLNPLAIDLNAVSSGTFTVGDDVSDDYSTWSAAAADLSATLTGNITFNMTSDITETAQTTWATDLVTHTMLANSNTPHGGDPNVGFKITHSTTGSDIFSTSGLTGTAGSGVFEIKNLHFNKTVSNSSDRCMDIFSITTNIKILFHDNLVKANGFTRALRLFDGNATYHIYNNVFWGTTSDAAIRLRSTSGAATTILENNIIFDSQDGLDCDGNAATIRNNASFSNSTTDYVDQGSATGRNNASEDATAANANWSTGTGNQPSITVADEIENTDDTNTDFMKVKASGILADSGVTTTITENTLGIRGTVRPHVSGSDTLFSIGADEFLVVVTTTMKANLRKNRRLSRMGFSRKRNPKIMSGFQ